MRTILLIIFSLLIMNIHFLLSRYVSIFELQPIPLLILAVFLLLKAEEEFLFPSLMITGVLSDCFFSNKIGPFLMIFILCGLFFKESRNVMYKDHVLTHVFFAFGISLVGVFFIYLASGVFALRAPIIISVYNAFLTPILFFIFDQLKIERLVRVT